MKIIPRDYQIAGDQALWNSVHTAHKSNPLVVVPTGGGKSLMHAMFCWRMLTHYPHLKIMCVTHVKELVAGNYKALKSVWPNAPAGIYSAGLGKRESKASVIFGGIGSVVNYPNSFGHVDFLLVDEAHRISDKGASQYNIFIKALREKNPNLIVVGYTATHFRMGTGLLTDGKMFDTVCFDMSSGEAFVWMLDQGYLVRPVPRNPGFMLDSDDIALVNGEYSQVEASAAMRAQGIIERAVDTMIAHGEQQNRQAWLTFCQSIEDAIMVAEMFQFKGYAVEAVHSKMPDKDRDDILDRFKRGELRGVCNKDILTTGFDHPGIDMIGMLRLTRSPGLHVQMIGRCTRPVYAPGFDLTTQQGRLDAIQAGPKQTALVLDFVGNTQRLGPINYPTIPKRRNKKGVGTPPARECPDCGSILHISIMVCPDCGYEFALPERVMPEAGTEKLVESLPPPEMKQMEWFDVSHMICSWNVGRGGKPDTMRVDYLCGKRKFSKWVCLNHPPGSFPRDEANRWWRKHSDTAPPVDVGAGVKAGDRLTKPARIRVWTNTKFPEVKDYEFASKEQIEAEAEEREELMSRLEGFG